MWTRSVKKTLQQKFLFSDRDSNNVNDKTKVYGEELIFEYKECE